MTVAESLRRFRKTFNLKQKDIATLLDVTPQAYQVTESKGTPSAKSLIQLANHFNVSTDYLLGLSNNPRPTQIDDNASSLPKSAKSKCCRYHRRNRYSCCCIPKVVWRIGND